MDIILTTTDGNHTIKQLVDCMDKYQYLYGMIPSYPILEELVLRRQEREDVEAT